MIDKEKTVLALKQTSKGRLKYDKNWFSNGGIEALLAECSSPPHITGLSPQRLGRSPSFKENVQGSTFLDTGGVHKESPGTRFGEEECSVGNHSETESECMSPVLQRPAIEAKNSPVDEPSHKNSPQTMAMRNMVYKLEQELEAQTKVAVESRRRAFEDHEKLLECTTRAQLQQLYLQTEEQASHQLDQAKALSHASGEEVRQRQQKLREHHRQHAKRLDAQLKEVEAQKKRQEEELKRLEQLAHQREATMLKLQQEVATSFEQILKALSACPHKQYLPEHTHLTSQVSEKIQAKIASVVMESRQHGTTPAHLQTVSELNNKTKVLLESTKTTIENANKKAAEEAAKSQAETAAKEEAAKAATSPSQSVSVSSSAAKHDASKSEEGENVLLSMATEYMKFQKKVIEVEAAIQPLLTDPNLKKYKFDLQKAVNMPINSISAASGSHLRDKLQRLCTLLRGQVVEVGGKRISPADHPTASIFCRDLFAKKIVKQGEEQVASNATSAFAIAAVTVGVWCEIPEIGELLRGYFHTRCPYTLPFYIPRQEGQDPQEYYKAQGYQYVDGQVEKQDKFLKRMSGIMQLYAALMVSTPPRGASHPHPYGAEEAWAWLTRLLNMPPQPDITAQMLHTFLQVAGSSLMTAYGRQFIKLLQAVMTYFLPKLREVTPQGSGGPITRLQSFLQECIQKNGVPAPEGLLPPNFWYS